MGRESVLLDQVIEDLNRLIAFGPEAVRLLISNTVKFNRDEISIGHDKVLHPLLERSGGELSVLGLLNAFFSESSSELGQIVAVYDVGTGSLLRFEKRGPQHHFPDQELLEKRTDTMEYQATPPRALSQDELAALTRPRAQSELNPVSMGCLVPRNTCPVCGRDTRTTNCMHLIERLKKYQPCNGPSETAPAKEMSLDEKIKTWPVWAQRQKMLALERQQLGTGSPVYLEYATLLDELLDRRRLGMLIDEEEDNIAEMLNDLRKNLDPGEEELIEFLVRAKKGEL